jgi:hydrogenase/urease accessory protein HupE
MKWCSTLTDCFNNTCRHCLSILLTGLLLLLAGISFPVSAHDARPVTITLEEALPGYFRVQVRPPPTLEPGNEPALVWPENCRAADASGAAVVLMQCEGGLEGRQFSLAYPLFNPSLSSFYRLNRLDGSTTTAMLAPTEEVWRVPEEMTAGRVALQYLLLGVEHILGGLDHLLFVVGLLVIARTVRRILWTITGFTLAHSITLSLSALGVVTVPILPVEAAIALSIVFLAHEISGHHQQSLTFRYPLIVSFSFGLLHGLGFASALGEIGLARNEVVLSLLFFNLGVETGQIGFILVFMGLVLLCRNLLLRSGLVVREAVLANRADMAGAYLIGVPATYWLIERVAQFV